MVIKVVELESVLENYVLRLVNDLLTGEVEDYLIGSYELKIINVDQMLLAVKSRRRDGVEEL